MGEIYFPLFPSRLATGDAARFVLHPILISGNQFLAHLDLLTLPRSPWEISISFLRVFHFLSVGPMADFLGDAREPQRVRGPISKCHFLSPTANVTLSDDTNPHYQYLALDNTIKQCHVSDANY